MNDAEQNTDTNWTVEVFFDGACPLCRREVNMLKWFDRKDRIRTADIAAVDFSPASYGKTMQEFMDEIQGRRPDGSWIIGVEVFRQLYTAIGLGFIVWFTRWPLISHLLEFGYRIFAKNRLSLTGRCSSDTCDIPK